MTDMSEEKNDELKWNEETIRLAEKAGEHIWQREKENLQAMINKCIKANDHLPFRIVPQEKGDGWWEGEFEYVFGRVMGKWNEVGKADKPGLGYKVTHSMKSFIKDVDYLYSPSGWLSARLENRLNEGYEIWRDELSMSWRGRKKKLQT